MSEPLTADERSVITELLASRIGLGFEDYRLHLLDGAVHRRMTECGAESVSHYSDLVRNDDGEFGKFVDLVTNNLSRFCRNTGQLRAVREVIAPELSRAAPEGEPIRVWTAGCATGEEPYSLAITLADALDRPDGFEITATDVSRQALDTARRAVYSASQLDAVPDALRSSCFAPADDGWEVKTTVRERVKFIEHNVADGPAVTNVRLALCRNVMIYLTPTARARAMDSLAESLVDGGFLFVGNSETIGKDPRFIGTSTRWGMVYRRCCRDDE